MSSLTSLLLSFYSPHCIEKHSNGWTRRNRREEERGPWKLCVAEPREARGGEHEMSGMEGVENWSKCTCVI